MEMKKFSIKKFHFTKHTLMFPGEAKLYIVFDRLYQLKIKKYVFSLMIGEEGSCLWQNYILNLEGMK